jgi:CRISPR/Cas system-associated protein endoribonuclease Cas2
MYRVEVYMKFAKRRRSNQDILDILDRIRPPKGEQVQFLFPVLACTASQDACFAALLIQPEDKNELIQHI